MILAYTYVQHADGSQFIKKANFAFKLVAMVEAQDNTGFLAEVQKAIDKKQR